MKDLKFLDAKNWDIERRNSLFKDLSQFDLGESSNSEEVGKNISVRVDKNRETSMMPFNKLGESDEKVDLFYSVDRQALKTFDLNENQIEIRK